uniref:S-protein homolog n=1 Tax=Brassica oleracea var. oleracea TaxID=109376 RepID=A0A0D3AFS8_BRAOL
MKWMLFSFLLILQTSSSFGNHSSIDGLLPFAPKHVVIINRINTRATLVLHCRNKEIDLGIRAVQFEGSFDFSFHVNLFKTTRYTCTFNWPEHNATFAIFTVGRDDNPKSKLGVCRECIWIIFVGGPCRDKRDKTGMTCFNWDSVSL